MYLIVCMYTRVIAIVYMCFILFIPYNFNLKHKLHPCEVKSRTPRTNNTTFIHHHLIPPFSPHNSTLKTTSKYSPKILLKPPPKNLFKSPQPSPPCCFSTSEFACQKTKNRAQQSQNTTTEIFTINSSGAYLRLEIFVDDFDQGKHQRDARENWLSREISVFEFRIFMLVNTKTEHNTAKILLGRFSPSILQNLAYIRYIYGYPLITEPETLIRKQISENILHKIC